MSIPFEFLITELDACDPETNDLHPMLVAVRGHYFPAVEGRNVHTVDSDWDAYGYASCFDYDVVAVTNLEGVDYPRNWYEDEDFAVDVYNEIQETLYYKYEVQDEPYFIPGEEY